jgi:cold shock CspA family protein
MKIKIGRFDMNKKRSGVVVRWGGRGFGFIQDTETRIEYFAHISAVAGHIGLEPGVQVAFEVSPVESKSGSPMAVFIVPVEGVRQ